LQVEEASQNALQDFRVVHAPDLADELSIGDRPAGQVLSACAIRRVTRHCADRITAERITAERIIGTASRQRHA
jgi:hypothetical protein